MPGRFRMTIGSERGGVARATAAFAEFARSRGVPEGVRRSVSVVLDELIANTLSHGSDLPAGEGISMEVGLAEDRLTVTLTDDGAPFDPFSRAAPDTTLSVADRPIGGLGIHLVRQLVDDARYERRGAQNVVVLTALLPARPDGAMNTSEDG